MNGYNFSYKFDLCFRIAVFMAALFLGMLVTAASATQAFAAGTAALKSSGMISGSNLTLGDIFDGLEADKASFVLGPGPKPGTDMVLNAGTLSRIASATGISWQPSSVTDQIVLHRAATLVSTDAVHAALNDALKGKGMEGEFTLVLDGEEPQIALPFGEKPGVEAINVIIDPQHDLFRATLVAPSKGNPLRQLDVSGRVERLVNLPVLRGNLKNGDIIGDRDLDFIKVPASAVQPDFILSGDKLNGMTPRRMALAGKPLRASEITVPQLVARGQTVTIVYESGPLVLTAQGRAMQDGARGDIIKVANNESNLSVDGTVTGEREVHVRE
jgi:flagella basal body P-ring formation protein FlgA